MNESLQNIADTIAEPKSAFERLKSEPKWALAFLFLCVFSLCTTLVLMPYIGQMMETQMNNDFAENDFTPEQRAAAENMMGIIKNFVGVFVFLVQIFTVLILSVLLKFAARFFVKSDTLRFKHVWAAALHASLISCLINLANSTLLLVFRQDVADVKHTVDLQMIPGLHHVFGFMLETSQHPKLLMFLSAINPLNFWMFVVMTIGVSVLADMEKSRARIVAAVLWALFAAFGAVSAS